MIVALGGLVFARRECVLYIGGLINLFGATPMMLCLAEGMYPSGARGTS